MVEIDEEGHAWGYNPAKQANPVHAKSNHSRVGMLYNPYYHVMGKYLQGTIKGSMIKCIDYVHAGLLKYDPNAYDFGDERLISINRNAKEAIQHLFYDSLEANDRGDGERKIQFMLKALDIGLFLMKEDVAYRWRFISLLQTIGQTVEHMEPTPDEKANLNAMRKR